MTNYVLKVKPLHIKISHVGFISFSEKFFNAGKNIPITKDEFNPVPYFLICKSIELSLKTYLICCGLTIKELRSKNFGHNLNKLLEESIKQKNSIIKLSELQKENLKKANVFYGNETKSFEYFNVGHAMCGFSKLANPFSTNMPNLNMLTEVAENLIKKTKLYIKQNPV